AVSTLEAARRRELRLRVVDRDDARAAACEPRRDVCRAAAELDDVLPGDVVGQHVQLRLGNAPDAPDGRVACPGFLAGGGVPRGPVVPEGAIPADVLGQPCGRLRAHHTVSSPRISANTPALSQ